MDLTQLNVLLKQDVMPTIQRDVYMGMILLEWFKKSGTTARSFKNGTFEIRTQTGHHSGVYNAPRSNATIRTGAPKYQTLTVGSKYAYGAHQVNDIDLTACDGDPGALAKLATELGESVMLAMRLDLNRQFHGWGECVLGYVNGASTGTTVTVNSTLRDIEQTKYITPGQRLLIGTKTQIEAGTADSVTVADVTSDTTFTTTASFTMADADRIVKLDAYDSVGAVYTEMMGVRGLVDTSGGFTTTFQGITRTAQKFVNAYVENTSEALSEAKVQLAVLNAQRYGDPMFAVAGMTLFNKYASLLTSYKKFQTIDLQGGFSGLAVTAGKRQIPLVLDDDTPVGDVVVIDPNSFEIGELAPISWMDRGEGVLKWGGNNVYEAVARHYGNLLNKNPKANAANRSKTG